MPCCAAIEDATRWTKKAKLANIGVSCIFILVTLISTIVWVWSKEGDKGKWFKSNGSDNLGYICEKAASLLFEPACPAAGEEDWGRSYWKQFGDKCLSSGAGHEASSGYFASAGREEDFQTARMSCSSEGAHLATISSDEENDNVLEMCKVFGEYSGFEGKMKNIICYIGYYQKEGSGSFQWADGSSNGYNNWAENDDADGRYAVMFAHVGEHYITPLVWQWVFVGIHFFGLLMMAGCFYRGVTTQSMCCVCTNITFEGFAVAFMVLCFILVISRLVIEPHLDNWINFALVPISFGLLIVSICGGCEVQRILRQLMWHHQVHAPGGIPPALVGQPIAGAIVGQPVQVVGQPVGQLVYVGGSVIVAPGKGDAE